VVSPFSTGFACQRPPQIMPYSQNFNAGNVGVHYQTTNEMFGDTTTRDSDAEPNNMTSSDFTNKIEGRTANTTGGPQDVKIGADCGVSGTPKSCLTRALKGDFIGRTTQRQFHGEYYQYHEGEDSDEERECSSSPCQAPWGYYEGFNHDFPSTSAPVDLTSTSAATLAYNSPHHPQSGTINIPSTACQRRSPTQVRGATFCHTCEGGHSQPMLYSCHPQNDGAYVNKESPKGTLIDSDKEECSKRPKVPTHCILQTLAASDSVKPTHGTTAT
jgi:hypothetical protein